MSTVAHTAPTSGSASLQINVLSGYALQIANYLIPVATLPFLLRTLGPVQYGRMAFAYGVLFFAVLFVDAGFNTRAAGALARTREDALGASGVFAATLCIKACLGAVLLALVHGVALVLDLPAEARTLLFASSLTVLGSVLFPTWLFQGLEAAHFTTMCALGGRLLVTTGLFVLVSSPDDLLLAATLQAAGTLIAGVFAIPAAGRLGVSLRVPPSILVNELRRALTESWRLALGEFATRALANGSVFLLGCFVGGPILGIYAVIEKLAIAIATLQRPLVRALFPRACRLWSDDRDAAHRLCVRVSTRLVICALAGAATTATIAPLLLDLLFGDQVAAHAGILRWLCLWIVASMVTESISQLWLVAAGHQNAYGRVELPCAVLQACALVLGANLGGAQGICIALALGETCHAALIARCARRLHAKEYRV